MYVNDLYLQLSRKMKHCPMNKFLQRKEMNAMR